MLLFVFSNKDAFLGTQRTREQPWVATGGSPKGRVLGGKMPWLPQIVATYCNDTDLGKGADGQKGGRALWLRAEKGRWAHRLSTNNHVEMQVQATQKQPKGSAVRPKSAQLQVFLGCFLFSRAARYGRFSPAKSCSVHLNLS